MSGGRRAERLRDAGFTALGAAARAHALERLDAVLDGWGAARIDRRAFWVPGRIEFLGKHTDYGGGRSLLCAVERGVAVVAAPRRDARLRLRDARSGDEVECALDPELVPPAGAWTNYPLTVVRRLARNFPGALCGADMVFTSDLPPAAGLSSSSALVVATFLVLAGIARLEEHPSFRRSIPDREALAGYLGTVENGQSFGELSGDRGVGTFGGSEDHTAMLCARPGALVQYVFAPVRLEGVTAIPAGLALVVASSGVVAEKTGAARERYNRAARTMAAILERWRSATGRADASVFAALSSAPDAPRRLREVLRGADDARLLLDRLEQFEAETFEIIPAAAAALAAGDLTRLGDVVDRSQALAERLLGNQVAETIALARAAREQGAHAASAFGAGFGGSVWALVRADAAAAFAEEWERAYRSRFPDAAARAELFVTRAGPAALAL